jgi:TrmH family RNA methyltransferase
VFVVEGPRPVSFAFERDAPVVEVYVAPDAPARFANDARARGIEVHTLAPGVAERTGDAVTSQGVFALVRIDQPSLDALAGGTDLLVLVDAVSDPGNAGTLWRSAAASGAGGIVLGAGSVDAYNPKLVRATAGACFSIPVVDGVDAADALRACEAHGLRRVGAVAKGGEPLDAVDLGVPTVLVLGHEARGLDAGLPLDARVTIPMAAATESLNLAMAGTVLCFEAARQRRRGRGEDAR